jgi:hypothetical protein
MTLGYMRVGTIAKRPWKLLGKLKFGTLVWPRVKIKKIPCCGNPIHGILSWACGQSLKYSIAIGVGNLWFIVC